MEPDKSTSSPSPSSSGGKGDRASRIRNRIDGNAAARMAFITGQLQELPPPPEPVAAPVVAPSLLPTPTIQSPFSSSQKPSAIIVQKTWHSLLVSSLSTVVALLLVANSLNLFPHHHDVNDIRPLSYTYLGTLLVTLLVLMHKRVTTVAWYMSVVVFVWIVVVEISHIITQQRTLGDANILWISFFSFLLEFVIAFVKSNSLVRGLIGMVPGPMMWMAHNFIRMVLTILTVIIFPTTNAFLTELPQWAYFTGGVVVWGWISMLVGDSVAAKLL